MTPLVLGLGVPELLINDGGRAFTAEQVRWLEMMRDHIATSVEMTVDDLDLAPFVGEGGGLVDGERLDQLTSAARTAESRRAGSNGFWRNATPASSTPWWTMVSSV